MKAVVKEKLLFYSSASAYLENAVGYYITRPSVSSLALIAGDLFNSSPTRPILSCVQRTPLVMFLFNSRCK